MFGCIMLNGWLVFVCRIVRLREQDLQVTMQGKKQLQGMTKVGET